MSFPGIPAFFTPAGANTLYGDGGLPLQFKKDGSHEIENTTAPRDYHTFHGIPHLLEYSWRPDLSLVKAYQADTKGNLIFRGTARNSNTDCAVAGNVTLVEAEEIVNVGTFNPDHVHLPGIYVDHLTHASMNEKIIEHLRIQNRNPQGSESVRCPRTRIAKRAAKEFKDGMYVNLGIGLPSLASNYIPEGVHIELQAENGLLGVGPYPNSESEASADWINAGKETITCRPGASTFSSSDSFGMIRGGHVDLTILGGLQCSARGDLASWIVPGKMIKVSLSKHVHNKCIFDCLTRCLPHQGMGGAMDLVSAVNTKCVLTMQHTTKDGKPRILGECEYPLTGRRVVDRIISDMGVFDCDENGLTLMEIAPGISIEEVTAATGCTFKVDDNLSLMSSE